MKRLLIVFLLLYGSNTFSSVVNHTHKKITHHYQERRAGIVYHKTVNASWYGYQFHRGKTASGERFNMYAMTAAHKTLPLKTKVKLTNTENNKTVIVTINDRGPYIAGRNLDFSKGVKQILGMNDLGRIRIDTLE